jgi:hypothetical protein
MRFKSRALGIAFLFSSILAPASSWASFLLEPYAGYAAFGSLSLRDVDSGSYNGVGFGVRGALQLLDLVFAGADLSYYPALNVSNSSYLGNSTINTKVGLIAGVNVPLLPFRFWVGYNPFDRLSYSYSGTNNSLGGHSFKFGAGFKMIPLISINVEYIITSYGSLDLRNSSASDVLGGDNLTGKSILFSASVPLSL